jgi:hypothetical protein
LLRRFLPFSGPGGATVYWLAECKLGGRETGKIMGREAMGRVENFRQYAVDCVRQAEAEQTPEDRDILLNVALAWIRLAQQASPRDESEIPVGPVPPSAASQTAVRPAIPLG